MLLSDVCLSDFCLSVA